MIDQFLQVWGDIYGMTPGSDDSLNYLDQESEGTLFSSYIDRIYNDDDLEIEDMSEIASDEDMQQMIKELKEIYNGALYDLEGAKDPAKVRRRFKPKREKDLGEADPYGGSMISPYGDEPSDDEINRAYDEAEYYISTELIDQTNPDSITDLQHETERYLEQIGLGDIIDTETMDQIIKKVYPAVELDDLKIDLAKDPALKTRFGDDPKSVIQKYQKRDS